MTVIDIFRKDKRHCTADQIQEVELFFMLNPFYNTFYEHADFDRVVNLTFYARVEPNQQIRLELNKKSEIVILLSGVIEIHSRTYDKQSKKHAKNKDKSNPQQNYVKLGLYRTPYELIPIRNDVIIKCKQETPAQFLFIPTMLYEAHTQIVKARRVDTLLQVLTKHFQSATKKQLKTLAENGCSFKQTIINNYIYRAATAPEHVYILIEGNIKLQVPGFSAKKMMDITILSPLTLFGDKDLNEEQRLQNALCCSSHCKLLQIPKDPYIRFITRSPHLKPPHLQRLKDAVLRASTDKKQDRTVLPRLQRFHSFVKPDQEQKIEKEIVENCHILIDLSPKRRAKSGFRLPQRLNRDYSVSQFQQKLKLFNRRRLNEWSVDPSTKFF